jgi:hypothetical protein
LTLQSPFSGFKDRQVTHKEVLRKQVGCKIEGKWSQKRKYQLHSGPPHGRQRTAFHWDWKLSIVMMTTSMSMMEGLIIIEV